MGDKILNITAEEIHENYSVMFGIIIPVTAV